jgi:hypothetical protein
MAKIINSGNVRQRDGNSVHHIPGCPEWPLLVLRIREMNGAVSDYSQMIGCRSGCTLVSRTTIEELS